MLCTFRMTTSAEHERNKYKYRVNCINPKKKSDFVFLTWHQVSSRFESASELKLKLMDDFHDYVPTH